MLMPDVFRGNSIDCVFGNIGGMIADPLEVARDEHEVQVAAQLFRILRHALDEALAGLGVHLIERRVACFHREREGHILSRVRIHAIAEHGERVLIDRLDHLHLW